MDDIIKEYLKKHLTIRIDTYTEYDGKKLHVELQIDGETISSDSFYTETWDD